MTTVPRYWLFIYRSRCIYKNRI